MLPCDLFNDGNCIGNAILAPDVVAQRYCFGGHCVIAGHGQQCPDQLVC